MPHLLQLLNPPKVSLSGSVKSMKFCDDETAFWQMASQHSQLHHAYSGSCHPHLGRAGCTDAVGDLQHLSASDIDDLSATSDTEDLSVDMGVSPMLMQARSAACGDTAGC